MPARAEPHAKRNVAVLVYEGVEALDFAGPLEVFHVASLDNAPVFNVYTVAPTSGPVRSNQPVTITPDYTIDDCPAPDVLVVPGGSTVTIIRDPRVMQWIKAQSERTEITMSVCNGAGALARQGLLDGKSATSHWQAIPGLRRAAPNVNFKEHVRFVDEGSIVTTAGVSAGIDGALHVVSRLCGEDVAWHAAHAMEYEWRPPTPKDETPSLAAWREGVHAFEYQELERAAAAFTRYIELCPQDPKGHLRLGRCQIAQRNAEAGVKSIERAIELGTPEGKARAIMARAQLELKRYEDAARNYEFASSKDAANETDLYNLGCAYALMGRKDAAFAALDKAIQKGFANGALLESDADLESLRSDPRFADLKSRVPRR